MKIPKNKDIEVLPFDPSDIRDYIEELIFDNTLFLISTILETKLDFLFNFDYNRNEVKIWIILLDLNILKKLRNL